MQIIMPVRSFEKGQLAVDQIEAAHKDTAASNGTLHLMQLDLDSLTSLNTFVKAFTAKYSQLNILINNAGARLCLHAVDAVHLGLPTVKQCAHCHICPMRRDSAMPHHVGRMSCVQSKHALSHTWHSVLAAGIHPFISEYTRT